MQKADKTAYNGILPVYKEAGYTSNDVVVKLRGILGMRKIGHTGTLDPMATGVLPICLGRGTKLAAHLTDTDKTYRCVCALGIATDTEDRTGKVLSLCGETSREESPRGSSDKACRNVGGLTEEEVRRTVSVFIGGYDQIPPMYSAKKKDGKRLYELARKGIEAERTPCHVEIPDIRILEIGLSGRPEEALHFQEGSSGGKSFPHVTFEVDCSRGTYIRSLCRDIGERLGCGASMASLERIRSGGFFKDEALTLGEVQALSDRGEIGAQVRPLESVFMDLPLLSVEGGAETRVRNGNAFEAEVPDGRYRVRLSDGSFAAVYEVRRNRALLCGYFLV